MANSKSSADKVIKGLSSQSIITLSIGIIGIVSFSLMSRLLTQEDFGFYAAIIAVSTIFSAFTDSGIGSALIQRKDLTREYFNNAFTLSFIIGLIASFSLFLSSGLLATHFANNDAIRTPLRMFSVTLLFGSMTSINLSMLYRRLQFIRAGLIKITTLIITTIIAVVMAVNGFGYYAILAKAILDSVLIFLLSYFFSGVKYKLAFNLETYKTVFGFSGWLMASSFFRLLSDQADRLLMTRLFSLNMLGLYTRPKEFITLISEQFNSIFDTALFPILSRIQDNRERIASSYLNAIYFMNIVGMLLAFTLLFNSELIIRIFLGEQWMNVNSLFKVLSISSIFLMNGRIGDIFLRSMAMTKQQFLLRVGQLIVSVIFIIIGARWGVLSVAVSAMMAYFLLMIIKLIYITIKLEIKHTTVLKTYFSSYKMVLYITPVYIFSNLIISNSVNGNILKAFIFSVLVFMIFIIFPQAVGHKYKSNGHQHIIRYFKQTTSKVKSK